MNQDPRCFAEPLDDVLHHDLPLKVDFISQLPDELSLLILSYISPTSTHILYICQCCSYYRRLANDPVMWLQHLTRHFPHLMNSSFCIKSYIDKISPEDAIRFIKRSNNSDRWGKWISEVNVRRRESGMLLPQKESKKFFAYLDLLSREIWSSLIGSSLLKFGAEVIEDFSLLRWMFSMSFFDNSKRYNMWEMSRITKSFPVEFPSVVVSDLDDICIPIRSEYINVDGYYDDEHDVPSDLSFENIANHSDAVVRGVRMQGVPDDIIFRCLSSLRVGTLTRLEMITFSSNNQRHNLNTLFDKPQVQSLERLDINGYDVSIEVLRSIFGLKNLKSLSIRYCNEMQEIPVSIGELNNLERLDLYRSSNLRTLPIEIGLLVNLKMLELSSCGLETLPVSFGGLVSLRELHLFGCSNMERLPDSIGSLKHLKVLSMYNCASLEYLPESIGCLSSLEELYLCNCSNLRRLPLSMKRLSKLKVLDTSYSGIPTDVSEDICSSISIS